MEIPRDAYRAIEDIVGPEHVTDDPAFLDSYAFQWLAELARPNHSHYMPRPWAVAMPASTHEVQAITRLCNKYKIKIKPISTGWYHWAAPLEDNEPTLQLDLRRMDRILDIDEKNMYAVVEPYVICAQLQAEVMKRGLNINIIGAGASTSIVASACAYFGGGPSSYYLGHNSENLLGQEWVTPAGEIVRTGSLSSGCGWFCSEGPGPSVRGVTRGWLGSRGGLGTFTKCAIKLGPWAGPPVLEPNGRPPGYRLPIPDNFRVYTIGAPDWDAFANIFYQIYDNEIGYIFHRQLNLAGADLAPALWLTYIDPSKTMNDVETAANDPAVKKIADEARISFQFIMAGNSIEEIELQDKILDAILEQTGGHKVERFCQQDFAEFTHMYMQRLGHKHCNFIWVGGYMGSWMQGGTPDFVKKYVPFAIEDFYRDQESHLLVECGGDAMMGCGSTIAGGGHFGLEQFVSYDPVDDASIDACIRHMENAVKTCTEHDFPFGKEMLYLQVGWPDERVWDLMSKMPQKFVLNFQRKFKEVFDPNKLGDRNYPWLPEGWGESGDKRTT
jgi:glycolate oxidase